MSQTIVVDPALPGEKAIASAASIMGQGGVVVFPTTGLYGLGADALNPKAVARVYEIKNRPPTKALLVLVNSVDQIMPLVQDIPASAQAIMDRLWPGGITLVFQASDLLPPLLCGGTGKIGIRMAAHPVARALVEKLGRPITGTSANLSGEPGASDFALLAPYILNNTPLALDAGTLGGGPGSTIVDVACTPPVILRHGAVSRESIAQAMAS